MLGKWGIKQIHDILLLCSPSPTETIAPASEDRDRAETKGTLSPFNQNSETGVNNSEPSVSIQKPLLLRSRGLMVTPLWFPLPELNRSSVWMLAIIISLTQSQPASQQASATPTSHQQRLAWIPGFFFALQPPIHHQVTTDYWSTKWREIDVTTVPSRNFQNRLGSDAFDHVPCHGCFWPQPCFIMVAWTVWFCSLPSHGVLVSHQNGST